MQVMLMRLMSKGEYVIVPKGTKFRGGGKLGLRVDKLAANPFTIKLYDVIHISFVNILPEMTTLFRET